ncbi:hypothetical protein EV421DRAFT_1893352 [Armillaria borealis]|uniref:Uncharacterized protein n=1 Tax=Armillaria borealis TaxID=47425 RepID=A0AA39IVV4_9AGAR|nr:hypothetical protein EV421DRAFT_1893352 [Armillaria borealis]
MRWFYSSTTKTLGDLNRLVHEVILMPDFKKSDLDGFEAAREAGWLDEPEHSTTSPFQCDGWTEDFVTMHLPPPNTHSVPENSCPEVQIPNIWHRSLIDIIRTAFEHLLLVRILDFPIEQIYGEAYTSEAFLEMEESIKRFPGCNLEAVVAPIMVYSDSTHLANFGDAALWPAYVSLGLLSKYIWAKVTSFTSHHLAYFPSLPDWIKDEYMKAYGVPPSDSMLTFLKQFMEAYRNGIVVRCADGVEHRVYPRLFIYSVDYPEKALLSSIKHLGTCLCPHCLIIKNKQKVQMAQDWVYEQGYPTDGKAVNDLLGAESLTPNSNAFSKALLPEGINFYELFVPDQMHEVEIGGWKSYFNHLIRISHSCGSDVIQKLNKQ